jgi:hypothetical protein
MARMPRKIVSGKPHEMILRISGSLPFAPLLTIKLIIQCSLARAQRDGKITICHDLWMGNHLHLIFIPWDPEQCKKFYQELQKKITDIFKRLTNKDKLRLWDGAPVIGQILDIEKAIDKIAYIYANPAAANLVDNIEQYPGVSSYADFKQSDDTLEFSTTEEFPWLRLYNIEPLKSLKLSEKEDRAYAENLKSTAKRMHKLTIYPNAWMKSFGIVDKEEIKALNEKIHSKIKEKEQQARDLRILNKKSVIGANRLKQQPIFKSCKSKPRERRVAIFSSIKELRIAAIAELKEFAAECRRCYQLLKQGIMAEWPPGAFRPPAPPLASALI